MAYLFYFMNLFLTKFQSLEIMTKYEAVILIVSFYKYNSETFGLNPQFICLNTCYNTKIREVTVLSMLYKYDSEENH